MVKTIEDEEPKRSSSIVKNQETPSEAEAEG